MTEVPADRPWRIVFFGSPKFSIPALEALVQGPDQVVLVVAPPAAPCGRGCRLAPSPAAARAGELGLEVLPTKSVKNATAIEAIRAARPDLLAVAAYGGFLPDELLSLTPFPPLNIHPSLLPRHRGAAPVSWSLIQGDPRVGVSIIFLQGAMDAGPILRQRSFPVIGPESAGAWEERLARVGAEELLAAIAELKAGTAAPFAQDPALATVNRLLTKEDGRVDWAGSAAVLAGLINGVDPWPGAATTCAGRSLKLFGAEALDLRSEAAPGEVMGLDERGFLLVAAGQGVLALAEVQPEGKKRLKAAEFLCGYRPGVLGS